MEKLIKSFGESQKPVTLYMDDIEKIIEIFEQVSKEVEISTTDYVIHDVNQLSELKQEFLTELDISIIEPHIALHLKPDSTWLYMNKDDLLSRGIFEKIKQILLKNKRPFSWLLQSFVILAVFFTISFFTLIAGIQNYNWRVIAISLTSLGISALWFWYEYQIQFKKHSLINLKYRIQSPSFFKRNSDAIILGILSAIFGAIISLGVAKLTGLIP